MRRVLVLLGLMLVTMAFCNGKKLWGVDVGNKEEVITKTSTEKSGYIVVCMIAECVCACVRARVWLSCELKSCDGWRM